MSTEQGNRKTRVGVVVSDKMDKTVVVRVDNIVKHPVYKKYIKRRVTCKAHDETKRVRHRRQGVARRNPAAVERQALAGARNPGKTRQRLGDNRP